MGHPILRAKALPVPPAQIVSAPMQRLIDDMFETMREYAGIGLAAPQVHEGVRLFVAGLSDRAIGPVVSDGPDGPGGPDDPDADEEMPLMALINPEITLLGESKASGWEGCLSIPDIRGRVPRAHEVRVKAHDRTGARIEFTASGLAARVIQHEYDHLDGILFFDRMPTFESLAFMEEYRRFWTKDDEE